MRIEGISAVFPSRIVGNDDILDMIACESSATFEGDLEGSGALRIVRQLLSFSGIQHRRWSAPGETPIRLLAEAIAEAVAEADCSLSDIDMLVYTGVGGGFAEPGNSYLTAHALGMKHAQCFDIMDACNSWSRALQLVHHTFRMDPAVKRALIVNAEFNMYPGGPCFPDLFRLRRAAEIEWRFPAFTIGEAATATVLLNEPHPRWEFRFSSRTDLADLCQVPEANYRGHCAIGLADTWPASDGRLARNGPNRFTSFGADLCAHARPEAVALFRQLSVDLESVVKVIPHASSKRDWDSGADMLGIRDRLFHIYPEYGNVVSASVPAGIALAREQGEIRRGDRLVSWVASAGMSFSACSFVL